MKNLKIIRNEAGLTQKQLGDLVGVSSREIYRYERGESHPSYDTLIALADVLNTTVDYIMDHTDNPNRPGDTKTTINNIAISAKEKRLITYYRNMNKNTQKEFDIMAENLPKKKNIKKR